MNFNKTIFFLFIFIFTMPFCFGYGNIGNNASFFTGVSNFDSNVNAIMSASRPIGDPNFIPLVEDLDGDGTDEIIVYDGDTIRLYQNNTLDILTSYDFGTWNEAGSNPVLYDMDLDGYTDIVFTVNQWAVFLEWSGSGWNHVSYQMEPISFRAGNSILGCGANATGVPVCLALHSEFTGDIFSNGLFMTPFNKTVNGTPTGLITIGQTVQHCFPRVRYMAYEDYDNDGIDEFIVTTLYSPNGAQDEELRIWWVQVDNPTTATLEGSATIQLYDFMTPAGGTQLCNETYLGDLGTSPLVAPVGPSNEMMTVVGLQTDIDEYKIYTYNPDRTFNDDFPEVSQADGIILSNPILFNAFDDTERKEFCVLGMEAIDNRLDLLCGSHQTGHVVTSEQYRWDITPTWNISQEQLRHDIISHSMDSDSSLIGGTNLDELVCSYGIFTLGDNELVGQSTLTAIYEKTESIGKSSVLIPADPEDTGYDDLLSLSDTNIQYIDDAYTNTPAYISYIYSDPPWSTTWQENTSAELRVTCEDIDGDNVRAMFSLYYGHPVYERNATWTGYGASGTTFTGFFNNVKNISTNVYMAFMCSDDSEDNNETVDIETRLFSVQTSGYEYGDAYSESFTDVNDTSEGQPSVDPNLGNNTITTGINYIEDTTHLGAGIIWMIIIAFMFALPFMANGIYDLEYDAHTVLVYSGILGIITLIIGVKLGFISSGLIWTLVLLSILVIGVFVYRKFWSNPAGG